MSTDIRRAIVSVILLLVVYFVSNLIIGSPAYDASVKSTQFLAAVIAAGCYWIGSNKK
ncbi:MAG: hypothetical protein PHE09_10790 [Oscillospiraceae bacterium]|nr:hypothetical protein [Oscillospiraceae bacterium]